MLTVTGKITYKLCHLFDSNQFSLYELRNAQHFSPKNFIKYTVKNSYFISILFQFLIIFCVIVSVLLLSRYSPPGQFSPTVPPEQFPPDNSLTRTNLPQAALPGYFPPEKFPSWTFPPDDSHPDISFPDNYLLDNSFLNRDLPVSSLPDKPRSKLYSFIITFINFS